jgi:hypothetical protein
MNQTNQKRKKLKEDIWDISIYTDEEIIHNLLNMSNPTDRELEIKIWSTLQQYKSSPPTAENLRWMNFYEQIYHRLFSFSEEEEEEEEDKQVIEEEEEENDDTQEVEEVENQIESFVTTNPKSQQTTKSSTTSKSKTEEELGSTKLVTNLQYATGNINPLLKETITRTLTIDSQYRDNKNEPTTRFLLNLTETIKNVVSIKLYSIHIPFTWYTISTNFGSNYFYIKGISPGIDDGNHDFKVIIPAGNYTQPTLATAINTAFQNLATNNPDISFGNTNIQYNVINSIMTMTIDIQNIFNQSNYILSFPSNPLYGYTGTTNITDPSYIKLRKSTIPSFLGFSNLSYDLNTIVTNTFPYTTSTYSGYVISNITDISNNLYPNNQIWIYQYQGTDIFDPSNSTIIATYSITIPAGNYSRASLTTTINNLIQQQTFLITSESYFTPTIINIQDVSNNYYNLTLNLNPKTTVNQQNTNIVIFLPDDTLNNNIWVGPCFQFNNFYPSYFINPNNSTTPIGPYFPFYQNNIFSEFPTLQTNYIIDTSASIFFTCITPYYNVQQNEYILTLAPSTTTGYILPEYITAVINAFNHPINVYTGLDVSANNIFNTSVNTPFLIGSDSIAYFNLDVNITYNQDTYTMDVSNSPLFYILNLGNSYGYSSQTIFNLIDLSHNNYRIDFSFGSSAIYDMSCSTLLTFYPTPNTYYGNQNSPPFIIPPNYSHNGGSTLYNNLTVLQNDIQIAFINYTDTVLNTNPLQNTKVVINPNLQSGGYYNGYITFSITNSLTESNYSMSFYDPQRSWSKYLFMNDNSGTTITTDVSYILSNYHVSGQAYSQINGNNVVLNTIIDISNGNNSFSIIPSPNAGSLQSSANQYNFTIPNGTYTRDQLLSQMNLAFQKYNDTYNTNISLTTILNNEYSYLNIKVNKVFTSSDYQLVFFDSSNFQQCSLGLVSIGNASWDSTLGWILGFRDYTSYDLENYVTTPINPPSKLNNISTIIADTTCSTTLFNYFILTLDDFNQNHTNDGLVTITTTEKSIPLPAYANRSNFVCDPSSGLYLYTGITPSGTNNLTQNQIYSITEIMNNAVNTSSLAGNVPITKYSYGPFITDVLAIVPVKTAGVTNGQTLIIDGGTLQTQNRQYFGPINLNRLMITLYDDRGHVVNLNNSNWSFTLLVDQIYKKSAASS